MADQFGIQPNFTIAAEALNTYSVEISKCSNLAAINGSVEIVAAIQTLTTEVRALRTEVQTLSGRVQSNEYNTMARLQNRLLRNSRAELMGLHDANNNPINSFPANSAVLARLRGPQISALLIALNVSDEGSVEEKRSRLRVAIGLRDTQPA